MRTRVIASRAAFGLVGLAAAGLLAACSGGGDAAAPPTTVPPVTSAPAAPGTPSAPPATATPAPVPTQSAPEPAAGGVPRCTSGELSLSLGTGDAGAGSVHLPLVFTNTGSRTCELRGFPGVSYVAGDDGHQVGPAAAMSGARGGQVDIAPGRTAIAPLQLVNAENFDAAVCRPTPVRGLRVYPPGDTASLFVPLPDGATGCAGDPPDPQLFVQTVQAP
jgi:hypothetical protein